jgi:predicted transcriptional regulator
MVTREPLHDLVDALPEDVWPAAERVRSYLAVPEDDEELIPKALARIEESLAAGDRGEVVSHEEAMRILADDQCVTF